MSRLEVVYLCIHCHWRKVVPAARDGTKPYDKIECEQCGEWADAYGARKRRP